MLLSHRTKIGIWSVASLKTMPHTLFLHSSEQKMLSIIVALVHVIRVHLVIKGYILIYRYICVHIILSDVCGDNHALSFVGRLLTLRLRTISVT